MLKGEKMRASDITQTDVLFWAVKNGNWRVLRALNLSENVLDMAHIRDKWDKTLLMCAAEKGCQDMVSYLLEVFDVNVNEENSRKETALLWGATHPNERIVRNLLSHWADVNAADARGVTPLMVASLSGYISVADVLLSNHADIGMKDNDGQTALAYAVQYKQENMVDYLLSKNADVDVVNEQGQSLAILALEAYGISMSENVPDLVEDQKKVVNIMTLLHKWGINWDIQDENGDGVLHIAARKHPSFIPLLVGFGAKIELKNNDGKTPADIFTETFQRKYDWDGLRKRNVISQNRWADDRFYCPVYEKES